MSRSQPPTTPLGPVLSPGLRRLLWWVFLGFALLAVNSLYLGGITLAEFLSGRGLEDYFYLLMFLGHLALGLVLAPSFLVFGARHLGRAWRRPNRYAVRFGLALYGTGVLLILSGLVLTRFGFLEIDDPRWRGLAYWVHVLSPLVLAWLFVLHRLAGRPIRWRLGLGWAAAGLAFAGVMAVGRLAVQADQTSAIQDLPPALSEILGGERIPARHLMRDAECAQCHQQIATQAASAMHRLSSFTNPAYRFSVEEARTVVAQRDGNLQATRLCAACHDPVPLLDGRFTRADFPRPGDPTADAGITCVVCHAIDGLTGLEGNGAYRIRAPQTYPFAFSDSPWLKVLNHQLIKAKPELHKRTFLKPLHHTAEFCSVCHKVHLPYALNHYRWLRGQDHYDSFLQSGVAGHRVDAFYYPDHARDRCASCHMPPVSADDPAARDLLGDGGRQVHHHGFAAANTGVPHLLHQAPSAIEDRRRFLRRAARVDIFGLKEGGTIEGRLHAPLRPQVPRLVPGQTYLLEVVVRTLGVGHQLTQGTADSNELWLEVETRSGDRLLGRSGHLNARGEVDPWAYFLNAYLLDRNGRRIQRRNAQDIFVKLYDHQIPPGAASVVHYRLHLPEDLQGPVEVRVRLHYRKFDSGFMKALQGPAYRGNPLPIATLAEDRVRFPLEGARTDASPSISPWERWNDYGIGLLREGRQGSNRGELRQALAAFSRVAALGRPEGDLNRVRVFLKDGDLGAASEALDKTRPTFRPWTREWFAARVDHQEGRLDTAIARLEAIVANAFPEAHERGFDFAKDVRVLDELGRTLYERARRLSGKARLRDLEAARATFQRTLAVDPEDLGAHFNLALIYSELDDPEAARRERRAVRRYRPDDNAVAEAVARHRATHPAADHAANPLAIYDLKPTDEQAP